MDETGEDMHVHRPKPLEGWRETAKEIAVIVVGIVIALLGEQAVEALHWRAEVAEARKSLQSELDQIYMVSAERIVLAPCLYAQLDRIESTLLRSGESFTPVPALNDDKYGMTFVYRSPKRPWNTSVWNSVNTGGLSSHFSQGDRQELGALYALVAEMHAENLSEAEAGGALLVLSRPIKIDAGVQVHMLELVEGERDRVGDMRVLATQIIHHIDKFGTMLSWQDLRKQSATFGGAKWCQSHGYPVDWRTP
jgi:hypothetical protein